MLMIVFAFLLLYNLHKKYNIFTGGDTRENKSFGANWY